MTGALKTWPKRAATLSRSIRLRVPRCGRFGKSGRREPRSSRGVPGQRLDERGGLAVRCHNGPRPRRPRHSNVEEPPSLIIAPSGAKSPLQLFRQVRGAPKRRATGVGHLHSTSGLKRFPPPPARGTYAPTRPGSALPHSLHTPDSPIGYAHFGHNPRRSRTHHRTTKGNHRSTA